MCNNRARLATEPGRGGGWGENPASPAAPNWAGPSGKGPLLVDGRLRVTVGIILHNTDSRNRDFRGLRRRFGKHVEAPAELAEGWRWKDAFVSSKL